MLAIYLELLEDKNDEPKFDLIYNKYRLVMLYASNKILKDEFLSEDAVNQAFMKVAQNMCHIGDVDSVLTKGYVVKIAENKALDLYRSRQRKNEISYDELEYSFEDNNAFYEIERIYSEDSRIDVYKAIAKLPYNYSTVMSLRYIQEHNDMEISNELGLTQENVRKRISRGKRLLSEYIEDNNGEK